MAESVAARTQQKRPMSAWKRWLLEGQVKEIEGPHEPEGKHKKHPWWQVMCLTGVDYFSTLGYQPGIAAVAAGALAPVATLVLVLLTLFGALPMYKRVAEASPHGDGSISMLENLLSRWKGKLFVLCLLGFAATGFIITITLSAADATAHVIENPFVHHLFDAQGWNVESKAWHIGITLALIALLGGVFLKGFKEAIGIAVVIVIVYMLLNLVIIAVSFYQLSLDPQKIVHWKDRLFDAEAGGWRVNGSALMMIGISLFLFPKLALGLSGFETGVVVMPLIEGDPGDSEQKPQGRIRNAKKLLTAAALIMSVMLITSSFATITLIPPEEFRPATETADAGKASGRALAYLAHTYLGGGFGTAYDVSTILILWFAGSSALAGLLNIVPRYLPRYGMAPNWAKATRPLVLIFTAIGFLVTVLFRAEVEAQAGAYATGVLALMGSAAVAVTLAVWRRPGAVKWAFLLISLIFGYTIIVNVIEQPSGIKIASLFIGAIILTSLVSRVWRTTELRVEHIELDETARKFIEDVKRFGEVRIVANRCDLGDVDEYRFKEMEKRQDNHIPSRDPVLFFEVTPGDASEFAGTLKIRGVDVGGYRVLRAQSPAVPNAIAAFLLHLRDTTKMIPHVYFGWSEGNPLMYLLRYIAFGEGDTAPVTREILRQVEEDPEKRPAVHVGG